MTARAAVFDLLVGDHQLGTYGITKQTVFTNYSLDTSPRFSYFIIMRWGSETRNTVLASVRNLEVFAHRSRSAGTDFTVLDSIVQRIQDILALAEHVVGEDGWSLTAANYLGKGQDFYDQGYDSISRSISFDIVSRKID